MSDTVKLIIEIPKPMYESIQNGTYCGTLYEELKNGIPLDDVKAEIREQQKEYQEWGWAFDDVLEILDNIGKDCRDCKKWEDCPCGSNGHKNGTSQGYSIGECKDYVPQTESEE